LDCLEGKAAQDGLAAALEVASGSGPAACSASSARPPIAIARSSRAMARRGGLCVSHETVRQGLAQAAGNPKR